MKTSRQCYSEWRDGSAPRSRCPSVLLRMRRRRKRRRRRITINRGRRRRSRTTAFLFNRVLSPNGPLRQITPALLQPRSLRLLISHMFLYVVLSLHLLNGFNSFLQVFCVFFPQALLKGSQIHTSEHTSLRVGKIEFSELDCSTVPKRALGHRCPTILNDYFDTTLSKTKTYDVKRFLR